MDDDALPDRRPGMPRRSLPGPRHDGLAALAILTAIAAGLTLLQLAYLAGADMVELQALGAAVTPPRSHVLGTLVGLALAAVGVLCAARISAPDGTWPSALVVAGLCLAVEAGLLLAVHADQWTVGFTLADTGLVPGGATAPGQWVSQAAALVLAVAAAPCLRVGRSRWRAATAPARGTPV